MSRGTSVDPGGDMNIQHPLSLVEQNKQGCIMKQVDGFNMNMLSGSEMEYKVSFDWILLKINNEIINVRFLRLLSMI